MRRGGCFVCVCVSKVNKNCGIYNTFKPQSNPRGLIIWVPSIITDNNQLAHSLSPFLLMFLVNPWRILDHSSKNRRCHICVYACMFASLRVRNWGNDYCGVTFFFCEATWKQRPVLMFLQSNTPFRASTVTHVVWEWVNMYQPTTSHDQTTPGWI